MEAQLSAIWIVPFEDFNQLAYPPGHNPHTRWSTYDTRNYPYSVHTWMGHQWPTPPLHCASPYYVPTVPTQQLEYYSTTSDFCYRPPPLPYSRGSAMGSMTIPADSSNGSESNSDLKESSREFDRWTTSKDQSANTLPQFYHCQGCQRKFSRLQNFSRHNSTFHNSARPYICRVPFCCKTFKRKDYLREHYWSHLYREGVRGTNNKMQLSELQSILGSGPSETKLLKYFEEKLEELKRNKARV
jgi:hypothetical protein